MKFTPVPGAAALGNLRFVVSYRGTQSSYIVPSVRTAYSDQLGRFKLTSNITRSMKLMVHGQRSVQYGINTGGGWPAGGPYMQQGKTPKYPWQTGGNMMVNEINQNFSFSYNIKPPMDVTRDVFGAKFTHALSPKTFYEVQLQGTISDYDVGLLLIPEMIRDTTTIKTIGNMRLDETPFCLNVRQDPETGLWIIGGEHMADLNQMRIGGHWSIGRDSSVVKLWSGKFDITSQVNRSKQVKAGVTYLYEDYKNHHGTWDPFFSNNNIQYIWHRQPQQGAAYIQDKLEFKGMIANVGLRLDYFNPGGEWYDYETYSTVLAAKFGFQANKETVQTKPTEKQFYLSPRLGISFPITENSKAFFNYGHFIQKTNASSQFRIRERATRAISAIGNPDIKQPRTVAYELGYEHNILAQYLLRLTGYYKSQENQRRSVGYTSLDGQVDYSTYHAQNYGDVRGFELTIRKKMGRWIRGFANYTLMVRKGGNFGYGEQYENRVSQREYERSSTAHYQSDPVPEPFARFNIELLTPNDFGPAMGGIMPLADWHLNFLGEYRGGVHFTFTGPTTIVGIENNFRWKDYYTLDLRLNRTFRTPVGAVQIFMDVQNLLNLKWLRRDFEGRYDDRYYYMSLHVSEELFAELDELPYRFVPGDDEPGDYRKEGVEFHPIEVVDIVADVGDPVERPLYYELDNKRYMQYSKANDSWGEADKGVVDQVLDDKAYIDMPNWESFRFVNPRMIKFGVRVSF